MRINFFPLVLPALCLVQELVYAQPEGMHVVAGEASIVSSSAAHDLVIETGKKTVINWDKFSIGENERVHFAQATNKSAVLNRVRGKEASHLLGSLSSNGSLILINSHGILLGPHAHIQAAGFMASTLDVLDEDFLQERALHFTGKNTSSLINEGKIDCFEGDVVLLAHTVKNEGEIYAPKGKFISAAGYDILLQPKGSQQVFIRAAVAEGEEGNPSLEIGGKIRALGVELRALGNPYAKAICHRGDTIALALKQEGGEIYLVAEEGICEISGTLTAAKETGGTVHILGDVLSLKEAHISSGGDYGGGTILIGGEERGIGSLPKARFTSVDENSLIEANAKTSGDGGRVIVWADELVKMAGTICANGGLERGSGGFIEISKNFQLESTMRCRVHSVEGKYGEVLLDPTNVTINETDSGGSFSGCFAGTNTFTASGSNNTIKASTVQGLLDDPCNLTITTTSVGSDTGIITISSPFTWTQPTTLTLVADSYIVVSAAVTSTNSASTFTAMSFTANGTGAGSNDGILLNTGGSLVTNKGGVILNGTSDPASSSPGNGVAFSTGTIQTVSGPVSVTGLVASTSATSISSRGVFLEAPNPITSSTGNIVISGSNNTTNPSANNSGVFLSFFPWVTGTTGTLTFQNCQGGNIALIIGANLSSGGDIIATQGITTAYGSGIIMTNYTVGSSGGNISFSATTTDSAGSEAIHIDGTTIQTTGSGAITLIGSSSDGYGIVMNQGGGTTTLQTVNGAIKIGGSRGSNPEGAGGDRGVYILGTTNLTSTSGSITLSGVSGSTGIRSVGVYIDGPMTVNTSGTLTFGGTVTDGTLTVTGCQGGSGSISHGLFVNGVFSTTGSIASNSIVGGSGDSSIGCSLAQSFTSSGGSISITASTSGTDVNSHGISVTSTLGTTGSGTITLNGTASAFSAGTSHGFFLNGGTISTVSGAISITGTVPLGAADSSDGVRISQTNGVTTTSGPISITGTNHGTSSSMNGILFSTSCTTLGSGGLTLTGSADSVSSSFPILLSNSSLQGTGAMTFNGGVGISAASFSPTCSGTMTFSSTINGSASAGSNALTVNAGSGAVIFSGAIGNVTPLGNVSITGASVSLANNLSTKNGSVTFNPTLTLAGTVTIATNAASGVGGAIQCSSTINGTVAGSQGLTLSAGLSGVTLSGAVGGTTPLGALSISGLSISLNGDISTKNGAILFNSPVVLQASLSMNTTASSGTGANISFATSLDGTGSHAQSLTLNSGSGGAITFSQLVGSTQPLQVLTLTNSNAVTASAAISASSLIQSACTGTSTFQGITTSAAAGINLTGTNYTFNANPTITGSGIFSVIASGSVQLGTNFTVNTSATGGNITLQASSLVGNTHSLSLTGGSNTVSLLLPSGATGLTTVSLSSTNQITLGGSLTATGNMTLTGPVLLSGADVTLNTTAGSGSISFSSTINGGQALNLQSASGSIALSNTVGATTKLTTLTAQSTASTFTQSAAVYTTGAVSYSSTQNTVQGAVVTSSNGSISIAGPLTLAAAYSLDTTNSGASIGAGITISNAVNGAYDLTLRSGVGNILFSQAVGSIGNLTLTSAASATFSSTLTATTITQTAGSVATTFTGLVTTSASGGISLTGSAFAFNGGITTQNGGPVVINNSGTLTFAPATTVTIHGSSYLNQTTNQAVNLGSDIILLTSATNLVTLSPSNIVFTGPVTLTAVLKNSVNAVKEAA